MKKLFTLVFAIGAFVYTSNAQPLRATATSYYTSFNGVLDGLNFGVRWNNNDPQITIGSTNVNNSPAFSNFGGGQAAYLQVAGTGSVQIFRATTVGEGPGDTRTITGVESITRTRPFAMPFPGERIEDGAPLLEPYYTITGSGLTAADITGATIVSILGADSFIINPILTGENVYNFGGTNQWQLNSLNIKVGELYQLNEWARNWIMINPSGRPFWESGDHFEYNFSSNPVMSLLVRNKSSFPAEFYVRGSRNFFNQQAETYFTVPGNFFGRVTGTLSGSGLSTIKEFEFHIGYPQAPNRKGEITLYDMSVGIDPSIITGATSLNLSLQNSIVPLGSSTPNTLTFTHSPTTAVSDFNIIVESTPANLASVATGYSAAELHYKLNANSTVPGLVNVTIVSILDPAVKSTGSFIITNDPTSVVVTFTGAQPVNKGDNVQFSATSLPVGQVYEGSGYTWSATPTSVATINPNTGALTMLSSGSVTVTAVSNLVNTVSGTFNYARLLLPRLEIAASKTSLSGPNDVATITITSDIAVDDPTWAVSNASVATLSGTGLVVTLSPRDNGVVTVTSTFNFEALDTSIEKALVFTVSGFTTTGLNTSELNSSVVVSPNPASGSDVVVAGSGVAVKSVSILSASGAVAGSAAGVGGKAVISTSSLSKGLYILVITTDKGVAVKRLSVE